MTKELSVICIRVVGKARVGYDLTRRAGVKDSPLWYLVEAFSQRGNYPLPHNQLLQCLRVDSMMLWFTVNMLYPLSFRNKHCFCGVCSLEPGQIRILEVVLCKKKIQLIIDSLFKHLRNSGEKRKKYYIPYTRNTIQYIGLSGWITGFLSNNTVTLSKPPDDDPMQMKVNLHN